MLRVIVELFPNGDASKRETLLVGAIYNDGTGDYDEGNYQGIFSAKGEILLSSPLLGHPRKAPVNTLVSQMLGMAYPANASEVVPEESKTALAVAILKRMNG